MFAQHFANHRIAWSRVVIVTALLLVIFGSPAKGPHTLPAELGELLGFALGAVGFGFAVHMPLLAFALAVAFALFYPGVVAQEETRLAQIFGERYREYCARVPRWIPDWSLYQEAGSVTVAPRRVRGAIFDAMWFLWAFALWEFIEELHQVNLLPTLF